MSHSIEIRIDHHDYRAGAIQGFRYFWAFYVSGFDQSAHCQPCFRGSLSRQFNTRTAESGRLYVMNERKAFRYLYICGVGAGPKKLLRDRNFHLPLRFEAGAREVGLTYNGYTVTVENAVALPIPELEPGWQGLDLETTRCKNFRFCVEYFGWRSGAPHQPQRSPEAGSIADARRAGR